MRYRTRRFRLDELQLCTREHYAWKCAGCAAKLLLKRYDVRLGTGQAPLCERCGDWMHPISPDALPVVRQLMSSLRSNALMSAHVKS